MSEYVDRRAAGRSPPPHRWGALHSARGPIAACATLLARARSPDANARATAPRRAGQDDHDLWVQSNSHTHSPPSTAARPAQQLDPTSPYGLRQRLGLKPVKTRPASAAAQQQAAARLPAQLAYPLPQQQQHQQQHQQQQQPHAYAPPQQQKQLAQQPGGSPQQQAYHSPHGNQYQQYHALPAYLQQARRASAPNAPTQPDIVARQPQGQQPGQQPPDSPATAALLANLERLASANPALYTALKRLERDTQGKISGKTLAQIQAALQQDVGAPDLGQAAAAAAVAATRRGTWAGAVPARPSREPSMAGADQEMLDQEQQGASQAYRLGQGPAKKGRQLPGSYPGQPVALDKPPPAQGAASGSAPAGSSAAAGAGAQGPRKLGAPGSQPLAQPGPLSPDSSPLATAAAAGAREWGSPKRGLQALPAGPTTQQLAAQRMLQRLGGSPLAGASALQSGSWQPDEKQQLLPAGAAALKSPRDKPAGKQRWAGGAALPLHHLHWSAG
jgi:hypothetical protein